MPQFRVYRAKVTCLALGALGGFSFQQLGLPLPWMLGAMTFTTLAAMVGIRVALMPRLRTGFVTILGVMLGSAFSPAILDQLDRWMYSFALLALYVVVATVCVRWFYRRVAGYDEVTAYFAAAPGGLSEMILAGGAMGGDEGRISLAHGARILIAVFALSFGFRWLAGYDPPATGLPATPTDLTLTDILWLVGGGTVGFILARAVKLPAYALVGPMLASAILHLLGITKGAPPPVLVAIAQVVVGSMVGARFDAIPARVVLRALALAALATAILLALALGFATLLGFAADIPVNAAVLAYAPGGLAEMSLIALSLDVDAAYVSSHHVVRIFMIVVAAPLVFHLLRRRSGG